MRSSCIYTCAKFKEGIRNVIIHFSFSVQQKLYSPYLLLLQRNKVFKNINTAKGPLNSFLRNETYLKTKDCAIWNVHFIKCVPKLDDKKSYDFRTLVNFVFIISLFHASSVRSVRNLQNRYLFDDIVKNHVLFFMNAKETQRMLCHFRLYKLYFLPNIIMIILACCCYFLIILTE